MQWFIIGFGGAVGAMARYSMSRSVNLILGEDFPYATLAVNVLGSLLMGMTTVLLLERLPLNESWRLIFIVGFLGSFTTFSTFSLETLQLLQNGFYVKALGYIVASLLICISATAIGMAVVRW